MRFRKRLFPSADPLTQYELVVLQGHHKKTKARCRSILPPPRFGLFSYTYKGVPPIFFCSRLRPTKALAENIRNGDTPGNPSRDTSSRGAIVQQKVWSVSDERYIRVANASYAFEGGGAPLGRRSSQTMSCSSVSRRTCILYQILAHHGERMRRKVWQCRLWRRDEAVCRRERGRSSASHSSACSLPYGSRTPSRGGCRLIPRVHRVRPHGNPRRCADTYRTLRLCLARPSFF